MHENIPNGQVLHIFNHAHASSSPRSDLIELNRAHFFRFLYYSKDLEQKKKEKALRVIERDQRMRSARAPVGPQNDREILN
jgi:hypothetical protein